MNTNDSNLLIDEGEIRAALSILRIDRDAFGQGVRRRVARIGVQRAKSDDEEVDCGGLLRIAASVLPVNLLGANTAASQTSLATVGIVRKALAYLALPAISFLMIAVTIQSWSRIRKAHQSQSPADADLAQMEQSVKGWWRRFGWIAAIVFALTLAAPFVGWTSPLLFMIMGSSIATASIVTTLGRAGLVDRNVIGGCCIPMLGILASVSGNFAISNNTQLLDPHLVSVTFLTGAAFLIFFVNPFAPLSDLDAKQRAKRRNVILIQAGLVGVLTLTALWFIVPTHLLICFALVALALVGLIFMGSSRWPAARIVVCGMALVVTAGATAFLGQTLWRPIRTSTLVQYTEAFESELVGEWSYWQATARWLQDQGIDYDHSAVQTRWLDAMDEDESNRSYLLQRIVSTGLIFPSELLETEEVKATIQRLLSTDSAGTQIFSIAQYEYIIVMLAEEGGLTNEQRDHLAGRLLATWRSLDDGAHDLLVDATIITNLLSLIDRPLAEEERKADVRRWLGEYQVIESRPFNPSGGFKHYSASESSDLLSTERAVRLMEYYGTHDSVDILALRTFLRPASSDRQLMMTASVRASTRQRLDQIPGISQPTLWDYIRLNQSLWFAVLLVGLCIFATLGSPRILKEAEGRK